MKRVPFNGAIQGTVTRRAGETDEQAVRRAELALLDIMSRHAKRLGFAGDNQGPNIGLEVASEES